MYLIYSKSTGKILRFIDKSVEPLDFYCHYDTDIINDLAWFAIDKYDVLNYRNGCIINGKFVPFTEEEMQEMQQYRRILTEEERLSRKLKPSREEIQKAEATIEILALLQEVEII